MTQSEPSVCPDLLKKETSQTKEGRPLPHVLSVCIEKISATLDGNEYDLKSEQQARWLKVLSEKPGVWVSSTQLDDYDFELDGARTDRLRKGLPQKIDNLIEVSRRNGARLKLA